MKLDTTRQFFRPVRVQVMGIDQLDPRCVCNRLHLIVGDLADSDQCYLHNSLLPSIRNIIPSIYNIIPSIYNIISVRHPLSQAYL